MAKPKASEVLAFFSFLREFGGNVVVIGFHNQRIAREEFLANPTTTKQETNDNRQ